MNEGANILADLRSEGRQRVVPTDESSSLHVEETVPRGRKSNLSRSSFYINNSVRDAIRRGAAENEVQKHVEKLTGVWRQMSTLRRRYEKWCKGDDIEDCTHKQQYEESYQSMVKVLQQSRTFLKSCVRARAEQGNINHPAYGTWTADFMLQQNET